ncbi:TDP-N-acetylfucosamine:lipid II N-acetylfucosaminyltransferase [Alteromonas pelagimontana]|uniref:TDP-N-acetylfucosamine:lipid II N-acetylfucosaminyltransferase n=1 Tax=Alteromonas pelagimontana TaxID=1858656 RepID=A0A6M4MFH3_9ALTE|nr:TDP-N-acetylfucosamine:lipid II N-acetylfucosaminyltransferase [Alteromonas pelagimontana]QJR81849.1 TDP-N-acetylfucosamine:lipid II N-acetylfucosaminyltransferase [Alteromonas pelagimontana]
MILDKFTPPFIKLISKYFCKEKHHFAFITSEKYKFGLSKEDDVTFYHTESDFNILKKAMVRSNKIVLHGLWRDKIDDILIEEPNLLKKSYWIMWGGDFYFPETKSENRKIIIRNVAYLVSGNRGDIQYVREHYSASGRHINSVCYLSNVFYDRDIPPESPHALTIQVGNSADPTNNHVDVFQQLHPIIAGNTKILCPLSYCDENNAQTVVSQGKQFFGNRFIPILQYLSLKSYLEILRNVDFAIFHSCRQQGFSNMINLLGMGKKVFINDKSNLCKYFTSLGVTFFSSYNIELSPIDKDAALKNQKIILDNFTEDSLVYSLRKWVE